MTYKKWMVLVMFTLLWLLGMTTNTTFGGWVHVLLIAGAVMGLVFIFQGRPSKESAYYRLKEAFKQ